MFILSMQINLYSMYILDLPGRKIINMIIILYNNDQFYLNKIT
jgi:hypothetical protein